MDRLFEVTIKALRMTDGGVQKKVTEKYLFRALSFTEGEAEATKQLAPYVDGEFEVSDISIRKYSEVVLGEGERFYKAVVNMITLDEKTNTEKKTKCLVLVQADTFRKAEDKVDDLYKQSMIDYEIALIGETPYLDVFNNIANE